MPFTVTYQPIGQCRRARQREPAFLGRCLPRTDAHDASHAKPLSLRMTGRWLISQLRENDFRAMPVCITAATAVLCFDDFSLTACMEKRRHKTTIRNTSLDSRRTQKFSLLALSLAGCIFKTLERCDGSNGKTAGFSMDRWIYPPL